MSVVPQGTLGPVGNASLPTGTKDILRVVLTILVLTHFSNTYSLLNNKKKNIKKKKIIFIKELVILNITTHPHLFYLFFSLYCITTPPSALLHLSTLLSSLSDYHKPTYSFIPFLYLILSPTPTSPLMSFFILSRKQVFKLISYEPLCFRLFIYKKDLSNKVYSIIINKPY